jgi:hypothetical protein
MAFAKAKSEEELKLILEDPRKVKSFASKFEQEVARQIKAAREIIKARTT